MVFWRNNNPICSATDVFLVVLSGGFWQALGLPRFSAPFLLLSQVIKEQLSWTSFLGPGNNHQHLLNTYYLPGDLYGLTYMIPTMALWVHRLSTPFTDEETRYNSISGWPRRPRQQVGWVLWPPGPCHAASCWTGVLLCSSASGNSGWSQSLCHQPTLKDTITSNPRISMLGFL